MEIANKTLPQNWWSKLFFTEPKPFTTKRDVNWGALKKYGAIAVVLGVLILLVMPAAVPKQTIFQEKSEGGTDPIGVKNDVSDPMLNSMPNNMSDTWTRLSSSNSHSSSDYLNGGSGGGGTSGGSKDKNTPMILARAGVDTKTQLSPGGQITVRLLQTITIASQAMPIIGVVAKDVVHDDNLAIAEGAKLFGEASFDDSSERAQISWRSIILPDGRERQLSAIGVGKDGQIGIEGKVHSKAIMNTLGLTVTKFIGAYAEGSMSQGALGASEGGQENGYKNAVAETAKDRTEAWAEDLKKEKKWIEIKAGTEFFAVLNQPFIFRDPGSTNGQ